MALNATQVSAQEEEGTNPHQRMIELIAEKFGKSQDEVEAVFEEIHTEQQEQRLAALEDKLSEAVTAGTITEQQKQLILEKFAEQKAERQERREESQADREAAREERQAEMEARRAEMETWAEENGIDLEFLESLHEGGPGAGQHRHGGFAQ
jgi:hypothetical protein